MLKRLLFLYVISSVFGLLPAWGAAPLGHVVIADRTISDIVNGRIQVPNELRDALKDPLAQRAYEGGAVGPDLNEDSHYNNTTVPLNKLFQEARHSMELARNDPEQLRQARTEIAFAYGWLSHMAVDLNLHPEVNAVTGDGYKYGGKIKIAQHAKIELAFTAFLATKGYMNPYHPYVPRRLLSKVTGLSEQQIAKNEETLALKAMGERLNAKLIGEQGDLPGRFERALRGSQSDITAFTRNPKMVKDWDLDCGKLSTAEFELLRNDAIRLNGGKLPANFGANYMAWFARVQGLRQPKRDNVLAGLIGGNNAIKPPVAVVPKLAKPNPVTLNKYEGVPKGGAWVLEKTDFSVQKCDDSIMKSSRPQDSAGVGTGQMSRIFWVDSKTFVNMRASVSWTVPDRVLIPRKVYTWRFRIWDNGSDSIKNEFIGATGSLSYNCPAHSAVTYDPKAGYTFRPGSPKSVENQAPVEIPTGSKDDVMWVIAHWSCGVRHAYVTYTYRYMMAK